MQVEQIDREAAERWGTGPVYNMQHCAEAFARHRHQARAEVVGDIVAWLREEARGPYFADLVEAKFGKANVAD